MSDDDVVWVTVGTSKSEVYHRAEECREHRALTVARVPTTLKWARRANLSPCRSCCMAS